MPFCLGKIICPVLLRQICLGKITNTLIIRIFLQFA
uniref:Uncharacterized protein n=1 Tax=Siphoviridae sp. ctCS019 TaxID=2825378 RepID=A0A8S5U5D4_9CAUD|nr:MAG TPA: hypothetical protein [Siphoviridae sp. ctCS019]